jgi:hypothetical protein
MGKKSESSGETERKQKTLERFCGILGMVVRVVIRLLELPDSQASLFLHQRIPFFKLNSHSRAPLSLELS